MASHSRSSGHQGVDFQSNKIPLSDLDNLQVGAELDYKRKDGKFVLCRLIFILPIQSGDNYYELFKTFVIEELAGESKGNQHFIMLTKSCSNIFFRANSASSNYSNKRMKNVNIGDTVKITCIYDKNKILTGGKGIVKARINGQILVEFTDKYDKNKILHYWVHCDDKQSVCECRQAQAQVHAQAQNSRARSSFNSNSSSSSSSRSSNRTYTRDRSENNNNNANNNGSAQVSQAQTRVQDDHDDEVQDDDIELGMGNSHSVTAASPESLETTSQTMEDDPMIPKQAGARMLNQIKKHLTPKRVGGRNKQDSKELQQQQQQQYQQKQQPPASTRSPKSGLRNEPVDSHRHSHRHGHSCQHHSHHSSQSDRYRGHGDRHGSRGTRSGGNSSQHNGTSGNRGGYREHSEQAQGQCMDDEKHQSQCQVMMQDNSKRQKQKEETVRCQMLMDSTNVQLELITKYINQLCQLKENENGNNTAEFEEKLSELNADAAVGLKPFEMQCRAMRKKQKNENLDVGDAFDICMAQVAEYESESERNLLNLFKNEQLKDECMHSLLPLTTAMKMALKGQKLPRIPLFEDTRFDADVAGHTFSNLMYHMNHTVPERVKEVENNQEKYRNHHKMLKQQLTNSNDNKNRNEMDDEETYHVSADELFQHNKSPKKENTMTRQKQEEQFETEKQRDAYNAPDVFSFFGYM